MNANKLKVTAQTSVLVTVDLGPIGDYYSNHELNEIHKVFSEKALVILNNELQIAKNIKITGTPKFKIVINDS